MFTETCIPGRFGSDCQYTCSMCSNGAKCNKAKDACQCKPGWQGELCNETCPEVT